MSDYAQTIVLEAENRDLVHENPAVLHIIDNLEVGGAQRLLLTMAEPVGSRLPLRIIDIAGKKGIFASKLDAEGVEIETIGLRRLASPVGWYRMFRCLISANEEIVHLHLSYAIIMAAPLAKLLRKRVVVTLHNVNRTPGNRFSSLAVKALETFCLKHFVDRVIAVGQEVWNSNQGRIAGLRSDVLVNVVPAPEPFDPQTRARVREELQAGEKDIVILATGRFNPQKDHVNLLSAFVQVYADYPDVVLWLAGDGGLRSRLEDAADCLGIRDRVLFLGRRDDIFSLIEAADIFVLSSAWEGFPLSLVEAMARGLPPVATSVGDVPKIIQGKNGLLVEPQNPKQLAGALLKLCKDPKLRSIISKNAERSVRRFSDLENWKRSMIEIYESMT